MDTNILQSKIRKVAKKKFYDELHNAIKALRGNKILVKLTIGNLELTSMGGFCPGTTLFQTSDQKLLYSIKMMNEDMALVVASENKKAEIEMEHAGKRLEEMAVISIAQQKKKQISLMIDQLI